jgi:hypothetical protein
MGEVKTFYLGSELAVCYRRSGREVGFVNLMEISAI